MCSHVCVSVLVSMLLAVVLLPTVSLGQSTAYDSLQCRSAQTSNAAVIGPSVTEILSLPTTSPSYSGFVVDKANAWIYPFPGALRRYSADNGQMDGAWGSDSILVTHVFHHAASNTLYYVKQADGFIYWRSLDTANAVENLGVIKNFPATPLLYVDPRGYYLYGRTAAGRLGRVLLENLALDSMFVEVPASINIRRVVILPSHKSLYFLDSSSSKVGRIDLEANNGFGEVDNGFSLAASFASTSNLQLDPSLTFLYGTSASNTIVRLDINNGGMDGAFSVSGLSGQVRWTYLSPDTVHIYTINEINKMQEVPYIINTQACLTLPISGGNVLYGWVLDAYGPCKQICGQGNPYKIASYFCQGNNGVRYADSLCSFASKPKDVSAPCVTATACVPIPANDTLEYQCRQAQATYTNTALGAWVNPQYFLATSSTVVGGSWLGYDYHPGGWYVPWPVATASIGVRRYTFYYATAQSSPAALAWTGSATILRAITTGCFNGDYSRYYFVTTTVLAPVVTSGTITSFNTAGTPVVSGLITSVLNPYRIAIDKNSTYLYAINRSMHTT